MNSDQAVVSGAANELGLAALTRTLWRYRYLVLLVTASCSIASVIYALMATLIFRAEIVVAEVRDDNMNGATALLSQLGGLANRAGLNLGSGGRGNREAQAILQSRRLAEEFIKRNNVQQALARRTGKPVSLWKAVQRVRKSVIAIREDTRKGTVSITVDWTDPTTAALWANKFVALTNEVIRARDMDESKRNIDYLNRQIALTDVVEMRRAMYGLIESQTKTLMLANGRVEYAFTVIDPAVPPEMRIKPQRTLIVLFATAVGALLGALIALLYDSLIRRRRIAARAT